MSIAKTYDPASGQWLPVSLGQFGGEYAVGTFTSQSGLKIVTGIPFRPRLVEFTQLGGLSGALSNCQWMEGAMDADGNQWVAQGVSDENDGATQSKDDACLGGLLNLTAADFLNVGVYESMNADGFTVDFTTHGGAITYAYRAYGGSPLATEQEPIFGRQIRTSAQSIPQAWTAVSYDTELNDSGGMVDVGSTPTRLTCTKAGMYTVEANVSFVPNNVGVRGIRFEHKDSAGVSQRVYATNLKQSVANGATVTELSTSTHIAMAVGDWIEVQVYQDSGGNLNTSVGSNTNHSMASAYRLGASS